MSNKIFPKLSGKKTAEVNLDQMAREWIHERQLSHLRNNVSVLLDPKICQEMVASVHKRLGVEWSFGGYLEDRSFIWKGSYLDQSGGYIHLGIDLNVPQGTEVACPVAGEVLLVDHDLGIDGGWGPRIVVAPEDASLRAHALIFAHLHAPQVRAGTKVKPGQIIATIGQAPENGNWYPHLHLQAVRVDLFREFLATDLNLLDGYGHRSDVSRLEIDYPDPFSLFPKNALLGTT